MDKPGRFYDHFIFINITAFFNFNFLQVIILLALSSLDLEEEISDWLQVGNLQKLEELVLSGFGDLLLGKMAQVEDKDVLSFLEILPQYQVMFQHGNKIKKFSIIHCVLRLLTKSAIFLGQNSSNTSCSGIRRIAKSERFVGSKKIIVG